jgi:AbrB family looped-hinge helix DNA binding protein
MGAHAKLTTRGQVTIPADVRTALNWADGADLTLDVIGGQLVVSKQERPFPDTDVSALRMLRPYAGPTLDLDGIDGALAQAFKTGKLC